MQRLPNRVVGFDKAGLMIAVDFGYSFAGIRVALSPESPNTPT